MARESHLPQKLPWGRRPLAQLCTLLLASDGHGHGRLCKGSCTVDCDVLNYNQGCEAGEEARTGGPGGRCLREALEATCFVVTNLCES